MIKIASGSFARAYSKSILAQVVFYYRLKTIYSHGYFTNYSEIEQHIDLSKPSISLKINKLIELGLIKRCRNGYRLVKYDQLWQLLGYDLTPDPIKGRNGQFKIHKINCNADHIKQWMAYVDIRDNLKQQVHSAFAKLLKDRSYQYSGPTKHISFEFKKRMLNKLSENYVQLIQSIDSSIEMSKLEEAFNKKANYHCNVDVTLSLNGICRVLGLNNTGSAHYLIKQLVELDLLQTKPRQVFQQTVVDYDQFRNEFDLRYYRLSSNVVFRVLSNKLTCCV